MKKLSHYTCFAVFMAFFTVLGVNAQIQIGTGTYITEKSPMDGYYNNGWSNIIYLASEIGTSGSLTSVSFYVNNASASETMLNQTIYVRHTSATSYTSKLYEGPNPATGDIFTQVYNGTVTYSGSGWKTITFNTPFNYNGLSNLEFLFENRNGTWVSTFPYFNYTSTPGANRMRYDYLDANFPSTASSNNNFTTGYPNIKLYITPCSFNSGTVSANASSVVPGNQITVTLSGQDAGSTIQWQSSTDNINFQTISGATSTSYTETVNQTKYYRAMVTNGGCSKLSTTATITADLSSMTTKTIGTGTTLSEKYPFNNYYDYSWSNMIYKASEIGTSGLLSRVSFSVGTLPANLTANNQIIYVRHTTQNAYTTNTYPTTAGFTKVFEGMVNYTATGWLEVVFDNQFYYNGTDNLEFLFENRDGSYTSSYPVFHSTLMSDTRTRRDYQDGSFPTTCTYSCNRVTNLMNIQMKFFPCTNSAGTASTSNANLCSNTSTTLNLADQTAGSSIQWQSSTDNVTFTNIGGATSASYNTPNLTQTTYYRAIATSGACPSTSNVITVNVSSATAGTASATSAAICSGNTATLNLTGQSGSIQWQFSSDNTNFSDISGATATPYTTDVLTATSYYRSKVTNGSCTVYSNTQSITVNTVTAGTASATNTTVLPFGSSTVSVTGQTAGSNIQWQSSPDNTTFTNINGATNANHDALNIVQTTYYKAQITSAQGCVATTNTVTVTVDESTVTTKSIGTGTSVFDKYPFNGYYDYSWATMLYKAAEINTTGKLTKVSFYVENSPVNEVMNNQKIYVRHTSTSEYSDATYPTTAGFTKVYDGTITYNGSGWKEITLQTPFDYNGVDDLEFLFENRDGSWTTTYPTFRGQSGMPENRVRRDFQDGSFPETCTANCAKFTNILNIQMKFLPCTIASGSIAATQTTVKPGNNIEVTLSNQEAGATIQWEQSEDNYNFKVIAAQTAATLAIPMTIKPLYIKAVSTTSCSSHTNTVTINPDNCFVPVTTTGTGTSTTEKYPFDVYYNNSWSSTIYTQPEIGSAGTITSLSFKIANAPDNYVTHNQKIYVRETTANDYPTTDYPTTAGFTLVYDGSITYRGTGWKEITLQTPFAYNGTSNLEFLFENRDGSYGYDYPTFEYTSGMSTYRTKRDYDDNAFPETCVTCGRSMNIPNVKFKFQPLANPAGTVTASKEEVCGDETSELSISGQVTGAAIQWQSSVNNTDFTDISGATAVTYLIENLVATTYYRAVVSLGGCSVNTGSVGVALECPTKMLFNADAETGSIEINIASIADKVGPYHYIISENPIDNLTDTYAYLRDTIFGDTIPLDSVFFFTGNFIPTNHQFQDLKSGEYYVASFDSRGVRLLSEKILVQGQAVLNNATNMSITGTEIVSTAGNAKSEIGTYMTHQTNGSLQYIVRNKDENQYFGVLDPGQTLVDQSSLKYGFTIIDSKIYGIENGVQSTNYEVTSPNMTVSLKQVEGNLEYSIRGKLFNTVALPSVYGLKGGIGMVNTAVKVDVIEKGLTKKGFLVNYNLTANSCDKNTVKLIVQAATDMNGGQLSSSLQLFASTDLINPIAPTSAGLYANLPIGFYRLKGIVTTTVSNLVDKIIYAGLNMSWEQSVRITSNNANGADAIGSNAITGTLKGRTISSSKLEPSTGGWMVFTPKGYGTGKVIDIVSLSVSPQIGNSIMDPQVPNILFSVNNSTFYVTVPSSGGLLQVSSPRTYVPNTPVLVERIQGPTTSMFRISQNLNNTALYASLSYASLSWKPSTTIKVKQTGFVDFVSSFGCTAAESNLFAHLKYDLDGYYHTMVNGKIKFLFNQEYDASTLKFNIYNKMDMKVKDQTDFPSIPVTFGTNEITIDVSDEDHCIGKGFFYLEVINDKKEIMYLRFYNDFGSICMEELPH